MSQCPNCSAEVFAGHRFCAQCGLRLAFSCPACGAECSEGSRLCSACGESIDQPGSKTNGPSIDAAPFDEYRYASILFADIVESTRSIAHLDAEMAMRNLTGTLRQMEAIVGNHGGTIVKTTGDGIVAVFGAPKAQEGHIHLACEAALDMRNAFSAMGRPPLRIGVHAGEIIFSELGTGSPERWDIHGLNVHIARRVQELATPGTVFVTKRCAEAISGDFIAQLEGSFHLRGISEQVEAYQILSLTAGAGHDHTKRTHLTRLQGRDAETARFRSLLHARHEDGARIVGISGPPGAGKTRLCAEFTRICASEGLAVYEAHAKPYGYATPLQLALNIIRSLLRITDGDNRRTVQRCIDDGLAGIGSIEAGDTEILSDLLGITPDGTVSPIDPKGRQSRLVELFRHLIIKVGSTASVVVVEDIQWTDEASLPFVEALIETAPSTKILLLLNSREDFPSNWTRSRHFQQMGLGPLSPHSVRSIVEELIGSSPQLETITNQIVERSAGNPFFAGELVRSLVDGGTLRIEDGDCVLAGPLPQSLPSTIQDVIGSRIDRLCTVDRRILQMASVLGKDFNSKVLEKVAGLSAEDLEASLGRLCASHMTGQLNTAAGTGYAFSHPLFHEVAYLTMLKARRAAIHASVASVLQKTAESTSDEMAALLAYHYESAGNLEQAAIFAARAAKWIGSTNPAQAIFHWRKTREFLHERSGPSTNDRLRAYACAQIAWLGWREGLSPDEARPFIDEAIGWARSVDEDMLPLLLFVEARLEGASGGSAETYIRRVRQALNLIKPEDRSGRAGTLYAALCQAYGWRGLYKQALDASDLAFKELAVNPQSDSLFLGYSVEHWVTSLRGRVLVHLGQLDEAELLFNRMLSIENAHIDPTVLFISHLGGLEIGWWRRDSARADYHSAEIGRLADIQGSPYLSVFKHASVGIARMTKGEFGSALDAFSAARKALDTNNVARDHEGDLLSAMGECHLRVGNFDGAARSAREAITTARRISAYMPELRATIVLGAALCGAGSAVSRQSVGTHFQRATELIGLTGAAVFNPWLQEEQEHLDLVLRSALPGA